MQASAVRCNVNVHIDGATGGAVVVSEVHTAGDYAWVTVNVGNDLAVFVDSTGDAQALADAFAAAANKLFARAVVAAIRPSEAAMTAADNEVG